MTERLVILEDGPMAGAVIRVPDNALGITVYLDPGPESTAFSAYYSFYSEPPQTDSEGREIWSQGPRRFHYPVGI